MNEGASVGMQMTSLVKHGLQSLDTSGFEMVEDASGACFQVATREVRKKRCL